MRKFITWLQDFFRSIPGEDGQSEFESEKPHDPEVATRLQFGGDFRIFERDKS